MSFFVAHNGVVSVSGGFTAKMSRCESINSVYQLLFTRSAKTLFGKDYIASDTYRFQVLINNLLNLINNSMNFFVVSCSVG